MWNGFTFSRIGYSPRPPLWSSGQIFLSSSGSGMRSTQPREPPQVN